MFNKELREKIKELECDAEITEQTIDNLSSHNAILRRNNQEIGGIADTAINALKETENCNKILIDKVDGFSKDIKELTEFKHQTLNGGTILKKWFEYAVLPQGCNSKLELTNTGFKVTFSPNNFNCRKFPEMILSVFEGSYNLESKVEIKHLENKLLNDIFIHYLLEKNVKLEKHTYEYGETIEIFSKAYTHAETRIFLEDIVKVYYEAYSQYRNIIEQPEKKGK